MRKFNIAIDGYSSCGKSTLAKELARRLGFIYVDSGAMYRAVTLFALREGLAGEGKVDAEALTKRLPEIEISFRYNRTLGHSETCLKGEVVEQELRSLEVSNHVSQVSTIKAVRDQLKMIQQELSKRKGVVMDGRDIGTVVLPNAALKLFMTADPEVRAQRRFEELQLKGFPGTLEEVRENLKFRDHEDTHRAESPLRQAEDAIVIDNTELDQEEQMDVALGHAIRVLADAL